MVLDSLSKKVFLDYQARCRVRTEFSSRQDRCLGYQAGRCKARKNAQVHGFGGFYGFVVPECSCREELYNSEAGHPATLCIRATALGPRLRGNDTDWIIQTFVTPLVFNSRMAGQNGVQKLLSRRH
jgi:hypothetical protein